MRTISALVPGERRTSLCVRQRLDTLFTNEIKVGFLILNMTVFILLHSKPIHRHACPPSSYGPYSCSSASFSLSMIVQL
jgi:hypothetical protein|eukprot:SAG25_NODE_64_length_17680_cov_5.716398_11_plen_79_part_00